MLTRLDLHTEQNRARNRERIVETTVLGKISTDIANAAKRKIRQINPEAHPKKCPRRMTREARELLESWERRAS